MEKRKVLRGKQLESAMRQLSRLERTQEQLIRDRTTGRPVKISFSVLQSLLNEVIRWRHREINKGINKTLATADTAPVPSSSLKFDSKIPSDYGDIHEIKIPDDWEEEDNYDDLEITDLDQLDVGEPVIDKPEKPSVLPAPIVRRRIRKGYHQGGGINMWRAVAVSILLFFIISALYLYL
jgi:hypothetical protein